MSVHPVSDAWWARAEGVIPMGTQTLSKSPTQWVQGCAPRYIERGQGAHLWDVDGHEWIDFPMALGPVLLGYGDTRVDDAIRAQLEAGITFTLMHPLEVEVAERIVALCPGVEAVRFAKSGSDAVSAAVRAARALTERDLVLAGGYHGWHDWYIGSTSRDAGVPKSTRDLTLPFRFDDLDHLDHLLDQHGSEVAAVVLEPSGATVPEPGYLQAVIDRSHAHGALCVFDEVITGFRLAPGGARERYGVEPDFSCYGKALGNGMPISAVGGRWEHLRVFEEIFVSGTHGGETLSLAAARAVLDAVADGTVLAEIEAMGARLMAEIDALISTHDVGHRISLGGEPHRAVVGTIGAAPLVDKTWVQQCLLDAGCLFNGSMFLSAAHSSADLDAAVRGFAAAFTLLGGDGDVAPQLAGPPLEPVFRAP